MRRTHVVKKALSVFLAAALIFTGLGVKPDMASAQTVTTAMLASFAGFTSGGSNAENTAAVNELNTHDSTRLRVKRTDGSNQAYSRRTYVTFSDITSLHPENQTIQLTMYLQEALKQQGLTDSYYVGLAALETQASTLQWEDWSTWQEPVHKISFTKNDNISENVVGGVLGVNINTLVTEAKAQGMTSMTLCIYTTTASQNNALELYSLRAAAEYQPRLTITTELVNEPTVTPTPVPEQPEVTPVPSDTQTIILHQAQDQTIQKNNADLSQADVLRVKHANGDGYVRDIYLPFDISTIGANTDKVTLRLYVQTVEAEFASQGGMSLYSSVALPATLDYTSVDALCTEANKISHIATASAGTWLELDVSNAVKKAKDTGIDSIAFILKSTKLTAGGTNNGLNLSSSRHADTATHPQLTITEHKTLYPIANGFTQGGTTASSNAAAIAEADTNNALRIKHTDGSNHFYSRRAYLTYDISNFDITAGNEAQLIMTLQTNAVANTATSIYNIGSVNADLSTLTWENWDSWVAPANPVSFTFAANATGTSIGDKISVDVTSLVNAAKASGEGNITFCIYVTTTAADNGFSIYSTKAELEKQPVLKTITAKALEEPTTPPEEEAFAGPTPSLAQLAYQKDEMAAFCHFGMNTYTNSEWGNGKESPSQFTLSNDFDAYNYVKALQDAGFKKLIVTAKHHDGFCIWPSAYTEHDIANSPYKNGNGDILAELSAACTALDMDMGLYLSPWDVNAKSYGYFDANGVATTPENDVLDYNEYFVNQLTEIFDNPVYGNNGEFTELWLDNAKGNGSSAQEYDFATWYNTFYSKNPNGLIFGDRAGSTIRWVGNEAGETRHNTLWSMSMTRADGTLNPNNYMGFSDGDVWTVFEADTSMTPGWFWHDGHSPKSLTALGNIYFKSVGRGATLLLNVAPNKQGTLNTNVASRLAEFGTAVRNSFDENLLFGASADAMAANAVDGLFDTYWTTTDGSLTGSFELSLGARKTFDCISLEEYIKEGQRISSFKVEYKDGANAAWTDFAAATTIGAKRLLRASTMVRATHIRVTILGATGAPQISEIGAYELAPGFSQANANVVPAALTSMDDTAFTKTGTWASQTIGKINSTNSVSSTQNSTASFSFTGTKLYLIGLTGAANGQFSVSIDNGPEVVVDTYSATQQNGTILYESDTLSTGTHNVIITVLNSKNIDSAGTQINLDGAAYLNNLNKGIFQLEQTAYHVEAGNSVSITIQRVGGASGQANVVLQDIPGTAVQGQYYQTITETVEFADGETSKTIQIPTYVNIEQTGDLLFFVSLQNPSEGMGIAFSEDAAVTLKLASRTFYVSNSTGNDSNDGLTENTAWKTLDKVNQQTFVPGDRILLKSGDTWMGYLTPSGNGTAAQPIIISSYGEGSRPIINGGGTTYANYSGTIMLVNQSFFDISNLEITNYGNGQAAGSSYTQPYVRAGIYAFTYDQENIKEGITITNCYIHDVVSNTTSSVANTSAKMSGGIIILGEYRTPQGVNVLTSSGKNQAGFKNVEIANNVVVRTMHEGIRTKVESPTSSAYSPNNSDIHIHNNYIEKTLGDALVVGEATGGMVVENNIVKDAAHWKLNSIYYAAVWAHYTTDSLFQFNEVYGTRYGQKDAEAFDADNNCYNTIFQYNYTHNNWGGSCLFMGAQYGTIYRYNISANDGWGAGEEILNDHSTNTTNINATKIPQVYNNTFYIDKNSGTNLYGCTGTETVKFYNNIIAAANNTKTLKFVKGTPSANSIISNNLIAYEGMISKLPHTTEVLLSNGNLFGDALLRSPADTAVHDTMGIETLALDQIQTLIANPVPTLRERAASFTPATNSPARNAGIPVPGNTLTTDIMGQPISLTAPSIGAIEVVE